MKRNKQLNKRQNKTKTATSKRGYAKCWNTQMFIWNMLGGGLGASSTQRKKNSLFGSFILLYFKQQT